ncbi:MAG: stage V sporulation protein AA [Blautia sp.]|nr:stage V sporulation protein AA [Candidatus Blautia excrementigallinarum]
MQDTLYLQLDANIMIRHPHVCLQDIARISCSNPKLLNRMRVLPVVTLDPARPGRYVMTVMDLIDLIHQKEPGLTVTPLGETDFILTYEKPAAVHQILHFIKIAAVCLITFFGAAFSIMTFNTDADVGTLFSQIYTQVTGKASNGFTVLEISYSVGLGLGVLFFFNHFGSMKITSDPTPMQVQMRSYEDNINKTIIEDQSRSQPDGDSSRQGPS